MEDFEVQRSMQYDAEELCEEPLRVSTYAVLYKIRQDWAINAMRKYVAPGARVLDCGAAQGNFSLRMQREGFRVTWNDSRASLVDYVRSKSGGETLEYVVGDISAAPLDQSFEAVLSTEVLEHVVRPEDLLAAMAGVLVDGGVLILSTPNGERVTSRLPNLKSYRAAHGDSAKLGPDGEDHAFLYDRAELRDLVTAAGFEILEEQLFTSTATRYGASVLQKIPLGLAKRLLALAENVQHRTISYQMGIVAKRVVR